MAKIGAGPFLTNPVVGMNTVMKMNELRPTDGLHFLHKEMVFMERLNKIVQNADQILLNWQLAMLAGYGNGHTVWTDSF